MDWYGRARPDGTTLDRSALHRRIKQFGLVLQWGLTRRRNGSGTYSYVRDWIPDTRFAEMNFE